MKIRAHRRVLGAEAALAFVWKTSYGDQLDTDTILVRHGERRAARLGRELPAVSSPTTSPSTPSPPSTPVREHMAPRIIGQDLETSQRPARSHRLHQGQRVRARRAGHHAGGCWTPSVGACRCTRRSAERRDRVAVGADFGVQDSFDILLAEDPGRDRRGLPADQAQVPARLGPQDGGARCAPPSATSPSTWTAMPPTRSAGPRALPRAGPPSAGHDRAAARRTTA